MHASANRRGNMLAQACSLLSPREPPLWQIIAVMVVKCIALSRGRCGDPTIIDVVEKFMGYNATDQIFGSWFIA